MSLLNRLSKEYKNQQENEISLQDYLELCKRDSSAYATAAERLLKAIGEPKIVDTSRDPRLGRIFYNKTIKVYPAFSEFYGMEEAIENLVGFLRHASQGLEEKKQILYLLGPVGGGKSSLAERLKFLMEKEPFYTLKFKNEISPVFESPLELFRPVDAEDLEKEYHIPARLITGLLSPWGVKKLKECDGDLTQFTVVKLFPSKLQQICITKVEPGDENNQDISSLVGKVDIRKLEGFAQNDTDAYSYSGGLNRSTQGIMEFVEMFKAPIKLLHPLLTATQEGNYTGTEAIGAIPFKGIILAHSNEAEWETFKNNKKNIAFIDRIFTVKVPYCLRLTEEQLIYQKLINLSALGNAPLAPYTLELLAKWSVLSRLAPISNGKLISKMEVYDGKNLKETDPNAKPLQEYRTQAGVNEGMDGSSTRFAFKVLSATFNHDAVEVAADPIHLMYVLEKHILAEQYPDDKEKKLLEFIKELGEKYAEFIGKEIQEAYVESYDEFGQNLFDRYIAHVEAWIEDIDFKDPDTGQLMNKDALVKEMEKIEKPSGIVSTKDFRYDILKFALRARAKNGDKNPSWTSYEKMKEVIEKRISGQMEELLPVISFGAKKDQDTDKKHMGFVERMGKKGYTERQTRRLVEWYVRWKSNQ